MTQIGQQIEFTTKSYRADKFEIFNFWDQKRVKKWSLLGTNETTGSAQYFSDQDSTRSLEDNFFA
jgi:hypothetical protein